MGTFDHVVLALNTYTPRFAIAYHVMMLSPVITGQPQLSADWW